MLLPLPVILIYSVLSLLSRSLLGPGPDLLEGQGEGLWDTAWGHLRRRSSEGNGGRETEQTEGAREHWAMKARKRAGSGERPGAKGPGKGLLMWPRHGEVCNNKVGHEPRCKG